MDTVAEAKECYVLVAKEVSRRPLNTNKKKGGRQSCWMNSDDCDACSIPNLITTSEEGCTSTFLFSRSARVRPPDVSGGAP